MPGRGRGLPSPLLTGREESIVLQAFFVSFGVIFVAELGDKSQLMALTFATRYRPLPILIGITIATAVSTRSRCSSGCVHRDAPPDRRDHARRRDRVPRLRGLDAGGATRSTTRRPPEADAHNRSAIVAASVGVLPRRARRQDDARDDHARHDARGRSARGSARRSGWSRPTRSRSASARLLGTRLPERAIRIGATVAFLVFGVAADRRRAARLSRRTQVSGAWPGAVRRASPRS